MQYKTQRLEIRPMTQADREQILDLLTDATVAKTYMLPEFTGREAAEPLFHRLVALSGDESRYVAGVYLEDRFIGMINATEIEEKRIEMGYAFLPAYYNRGYGTECFRGAIDYLLDRGFETVLAGAFSENKASIRVMEKCGMTLLPQTDTQQYRGKTYTCVYYGASKEH